MVAATGPTVFVHIVTFDSPACVVRCVASILAQSGFTAGQNLLVHVTDNASQNVSPALIERQFAQLVQVHRNDANLGFCAGHNQGVRRFLDGAADYLLVLNPDVRLEDGALLALVSALAASPQAGSACARLLRADSELDPISPALIDSAGIVVTSALRHFDRGAGQPDGPAFAESAEVFGGTGACLLLRRAFVEDALLASCEQDEALFSIYPQLRNGSKDRAPLFDESFFAYREDADLAWRAQLLGWGCIYVGQARGWHTRVVRSDNRRELAPELNLMGVRNRFLLQLNNLGALVSQPRVVLEGVILRNAIVMVGVLLRERSSFEGLLHVLRLLPRALARRRRVMARAVRSARDVGHWFRQTRSEKI